jgi:hypothetical protein
MKKLYGPQKPSKLQSWDKFLNPERGYKAGNNDPQPPITQLNLPKHKYDVKGSHQFVLVPTTRARVQGNGQFKGRAELTITPEN